MDAVKQREVPWCSVCLVFFALTCHACVLYGNLNTAAGVTDIGLSTKGWSGVGREIAHSLHVELDEIMGNLTSMLVESINGTLHVQGMLDTVMGLAGNATERIKGPEVTQAVALLQQHADPTTGVATAGVLGTVVTTAVDKVLDVLMQKVIEGLDKLLVLLTPALQEVGRFLHKFSDKIQQFIESFSITLDRVQKIFDQVMAKLSKTGGSEEDLLRETFNLFDVSNTGTILASDLRHVANLYAISALTGDKPEQLVEKYDVTGDGQLDHEEFADMVKDPSIPNCMPMLLRSFAKRLAEASGNLASSRFRDEIAIQVTKYLQLMTAKNMTKVGWVTDALTNNSLPLEFTRDVLAELALAVDDPAVLTTADVGLWVMREMLNHNKANTIAAYELLSNETQWVLEGFRPSDQPVVIERVTTWLVKGSGVEASNLLQLSGTGSDFGEGANLSKAQLVAIEEVLEAMPDIAKKLSEQKLQAHVSGLKASEKAHYASLFATKAAQSLLMHLNGGSYASEPKAESNPATRAVHQGVLAFPETLLFAKFLSWNSSSTAARFQSYAFDYSQESSNAIDSFATQVQGMVKKIQSFITMMKQYSTPAGIEAITKKVHDFAMKAAGDLLKTVKFEVDKVMKQYLPEVDAALHDSLHQAGEAIGNMITDALANPLGQALEPAIGGILRSLVGEPAAEELGGQLGDLISGQVTNLTGDALGQQIGDLLDDLVSKALTAGAKLVNQSISGFSLIEAPRSNVTSTFSRAHLSRQYLQLLPPPPDCAAGARPSTCYRSGMHAILLEEAAGEGSRDVTSGVWNELTQLLKSLTHVLPQAQQSLKTARLEVSGLSSGLEAIFEPFETKGPEIFDKISSMWKMVWILYFCFLAPVTASLLLYAFWASGWFGGPGTPPQGDEPMPPEEERTFMWKVQLCCCTCCAGFRNYHDWHLCFWSILIILQIFVLLLFVMALVMCIIGGLEMFVASGCAQIYPLGDAAVCGQVLVLFRKFLETFLQGTALEALEGQCQQRDLLTCEMVAGNMKSAAIYTSAFSFLAAIVSFQMLIESSLLHTRAVWRRRLAFAYLAEKND